MATIFQAPLMTDFLYPFLLIFFIIFAILEKTSILGTDKKQLNALVSLVIGLIFVGAVFPKVIVENMVLFMTVGLVVIFVGLMLWGFVSGKSDFSGQNGVPKVFIWIIAIAMIFAVMWATGIASLLQPALAFLFDSQWSGTFWTNLLFVGLVAGAIAIVLKSKGAASGGDKK